MSYSKKKEKKKVAAADKKGGERMKSGRGGLKGEVELMKRGEINERWQPVRQINSHIRL